MTDPDCPLCGLWPHAEHCPSSGCSVCASKRALTQHGALWLCRVCVDRWWFVATGCDRAAVYLHQEFP